MSEQLDMGDPIGSGHGVGMLSRRTFLFGATGGAAALMITATALAQDGANHIKGATAITRVFGDGARLIAVAVEYDAPVVGAALSAADFKVEGRTVTGAFASTSADPSGRTDTGRFVIVTLSPDDANAGLARKIDQPAGGAGGRGGPGKAGDIPVYDTTWPPASATVAQSAPVALADGRKAEIGGGAIETSAVRNLIVDEFEQREFTDPATGRLLRYNLFVPKDYDASRSYPLVLFMHDAGATSDQTRTTLFQGLGAICWAGPEDQAERPCFVLAPQFAEIIADDDSRTSDALDATINLIGALAGQYGIDTTRLYATGQSGGCMMSIAMNIQYPDLFAASFLVAGQWDPALVKPLARKKLWILVSQDDDKAFPGENAITQALEKEGAKISRAVWDGTWDAQAFRTAFDKIDAEGAPINYVSFAPGSVIPEGQSTAGAGGHRNTWRIAYTIAPIREWIFRQHQ